MITETYKHKISYDLKKEFDDEINLTTNMMVRKKPISSLLTRDKSIKYTSPRLPRGSREFDTETESKPDMVAHAHDKSSRKAKAGGLSGGGQYGLYKQALPY